jgi:hypothetical protein
MFFNKPACRDRIDAAPVWNEIVLDVATVRVGHLNRHFRQVSPNGFRRGFHYPIDRDVPGAEIFCVEHCFDGGSMIDLNKTLIISGDCGALARAARHLLEVASPGEQLVAGSGL